jgi:hypothetical protein
MPANQAELTWLTLEPVGIAGSPYYSLGPAYKAIQTPMGTEFAWYKGMYQRNHNKVIGVGAWFSIHATSAPMFLCLGVWVQRAARTSSWSIVGILRKLPVHDVLYLVDNA